MLYEKKLTLRLPSIALKVKRLQNSNLIVFLDRSFVKCARKTQRRKRGQMHAIHSPPICRVGPIPFVFYFEFDAIEKVDLSYKNPNLWFLLKRSEEFQQRVRISKSNSSPPAQDGGCPGVCEHLQEQCVVSCCCYNKSPQSNRLAATPVDYLTALEFRNLKYTGIQV